MTACGCAGDDLLPVDTAIAHLLESAVTLLATEMICLADARGRVLAGNVAAPLDVPAWDNSAMDGYAVRAADLPTGGACLPLAGRITAGSTPGALPSGYAMRIFTGAPLPEGADTVVAQEDCGAGDGEVWLPAQRRGAHVRWRGEEWRQGAPVLTAGRRLRAQELGLLASLGQARVSVYRRLRVGLVSSGDELCEPGEPLRIGQVYNANRYSISAALESLGCLVQNFGVAADTPAATRAVLSAAAAECDVIISSGGVSVGEEDHLKQVVREMGRLDLWRLAIQPGKPLAFGDVLGRPWLGLPGNPAAALITTLMVARPYLLRLQGVVDVLPTTVRIPAGFDWPQARSRRQYLRARLELDSTGHQAVKLHAQQGSAMLGAAAWADGLAVIDCGKTLDKGELVEFIFFSELM